jgi:hypothetical protein
VTRTISLPIHSVLELLGGVALLDAGHADALDAGLSPRPRAQRGAFGRTLSVPPVGATRARSL